MAELGKQERTTAKRMLTMAQKRVTKAVEENLSVDIVQSRFNDVNQRWLTLLDKHEKYLHLEHPNGNIPSEEEEWLDKVTEEYDAMELEVDKVMKTKIVNVEDKLKDLTALKNTERIYRFEESTLKILMSEMYVTLENEESTVQTIKEAQADLRNQHNRYKDSQRELVKFVDTPMEETIQQIQTDITKLSIAVGKSIEMRTEQNKTKVSDQLKLERMKMPTFNGNIRDYPRFKNDFNKQVMPAIAKESAAYILKSCLSGEPLEVVKNVDDDLDEMWSRLEDRFGRISKITDAIMFDIKKMKPVNDGDEKRFSEMVNAIEGSYRDLERIDMQGEISNSTVVSMIEEKLPKSVKVQWCLQVCDANNEINYRDKFPQLLTFLLKHKRAMEYGSNDLRMPSLNRQGQVHFGQGQFDRPKLAKEICWIHKDVEQTVTHPIWKCREFLSQPVPDRIQLVIRNKACQTCLLIGCPDANNSKQCNSGFKCKEQGCAQLHNNLLHKKSPDQLLAGATNYTNNSNYESSLNSTILPVQNI